MLDRTTVPPSAGERTRTLNVGTRGSALAMYQTKLVVDLLRQRHPDVTFNVQVISTQGDRDKETPLSVIGGQGVFIKELEAAILTGAADCAVHSLKDLPSVLPENLLLAAILDRDDPRDVLISQHPDGIAGLPTGAKVGTSSRRRVAQLRIARPDVEVIELRGNVDTRISKVMAGDSTYDAGILAAAGVLRMKRDDLAMEFLDVDTFTPAPGQAALAIECPEDDLATRAILATVHDEEVALLTGTERAFLRGVGGGCRSPVGAYAENHPDGIRLRGMLASESLTLIERVDTVLKASDATEQAEAIARDLIARLGE